MKKLIKLLLIIPTLDRSGAEKQLTLLALGLPKDLFDVQVCLLTRDGPYSKILQKHNIPYFLIGKKGKLDLRAYLRLKKLIRNFNPDIVHTWLFAANAYGRKAAWACHVPVIIAGERCVDPWKKFWHDWIDRKLAKITDRIAVNSQGIKDFYVAKGLDPNLFTVIPNAFVTNNSLNDSSENSLSNSISDSQTAKDSLITENSQTINDSKTANDFKTANDSKTVMNFSGVKDSVNFDDGSSAAEKKAQFRIPTKLELLRELGISVKSEKKMPFLIGMVARLWPQKRIQEAIFSCDQLKYLGVDFYMVIIGDGPERDILLRYRNDLQIEDRVIFLGHRSDLDRFWPNFDLFWCTSAYEGQSNSIMEAMAAGIPVIASNIPGNRELVVHEKTGILISEFDGDLVRRRTAFMHESMMLLLPENEQRRKDLGQAAAERIRNHFSLEQMIRRYSDLYIGALKEKSEQ